MLVLILFLASLASWAQIPTGGAAGVGGAGDLTTVGAIPYVSAAGILNQDSGLSWDAANDRATFGLSRVGTGIGGGAEFSDRNAFNTQNFGFAQIGTVSILNGSTVSLRVGNVDAAVVAPTTRNLLIGTTTDSNFKLDVAASGSAGTMRVYDATATTGVTTAVIRAGAGQSNNAVFTVQDSGGSAVLSVNTGNAYTATALDFGNASRNAELRTTGFVTGSATPFRFSSTTNSNGTADLSLSRASAGVLQVGDGGSNANGYLSAARIGVGTTSPGSALDIRAAGSGTVGPTLSLINSAASVVGNAADINMAGNPGGGPLAPTGRIRLTEGVNAAGTFSFWTYDGSGGASGFNEKMTIGPDGVVQIYNNRATIGVTRAVIRAGAGQSTTNLTEWQDSSGVVTARLRSDFRFEAHSLYSISGSNAAGFNYTQLDLPSVNVIAWSNSATNGFGTKDLGISRSSAGLLEINSGTAIGTTPGNARDVRARGFYTAETTSDPSAAELSIAGSNAQDTFRLYMKNDKLVVAYNRSGTVNYLTIPLDGATTTWTQSTTAP